MAKRTKKGSITPVGVESVNIDILNIGENVDGMPVSKVQTADDNNAALVSDPNIGFTRPKLTTIPNNVIVGQNYTNRKEYQQKYNIDTNKLRDQLKDDELAASLERPRFGLELTDDEKIFFYECLFGWNNGQSINASDPDNKYFLVNSITGRYGDVVIGMYENGVPHILWKEMAEDFQGIKSGQQRASGKATKKDLAKIKDQTHNFKRMVTNLVSDVKKRVIVSYMEKNDLGEMVTIENIVQPLTLSRVTKNGVIYIVLRFADFMTYQRGTATTKYPPAPKELMKAIQKGNATATLNLVCAIRTWLSSNLKVLKIDKARTKKYASEHKGKTGAHVVVFSRSLDILIRTASETNVSRGHHKAARHDFGTAVKNLLDAGIINGIEGDADFTAWFMDQGTPTLPAKYKSWGDFYKKNKVILYIVKDY